jgi:hypothetical protein
MKEGPMSFNSNSYYRNKYRREALEYLAKAREIRANHNPIREQLLPGSQERDIEFNVKMARSRWRLYQIQRRICRLENA